MTTAKDLEDNLKKFIIDEQSDAHNVKSANFAKYNNMKVSFDSKKYNVPHFIVRITISEAAFSLSDCSKIQGGLGYEEKFISKWYGRSGTKEKIQDAWDNHEKNEGN